MTAFTTYYDRPWPTRNQLIPKSENIIHLQGRFSLQFILRPCSKVYTSSMLKAPITKIIGNSNAWQTLHDFLSMMSRLNYFFFFLICLLPFFIYMIFCQ